MATEDKKISEVTALGEKLATDDKIPIADTSAGETKSVTISDLVGNTTEWDYIVYDDSGTYRAVDGSTGAEDSNSSDAGALLNALIAKLTIGGRIFIKASANVYSLSTTQLTLDQQGIWVEGEGNSSDAGIGVEFECTTASVDAITISKDDCKLKHIRISGNTSDSAIAITQADKMVLEDIRIDSPATHVTPFTRGISFEPTGTQTAQICFVNNIVINGCKNGIVMNGAVGAACGNNSFNNIRILSIDTGGIYWWFQERCDHNRISNSQLGTVTEANCITFQFGESGGINDHIYGQQISNCHFGVQDASTTFCKVYDELVMTPVDSVKPAIFTNVTFEGNASATLITLAETDAKNPEFYGVGWNVNIDTFSNYQSGKGIIEIANSDTTQSVNALEIFHRTDGNMGNAFGSTIEFFMEDATSGKKSIAKIKAVRAGGSDNQGSLQLYGINTSFADFFTVERAGNVSVRPTRKIYLDGAASTGIGSDTYFHEESADDVEAIVGGEIGLKMEETGTEVNVVPGAQNILATDATDGFLYIPYCQGTPTGTPSAYTGKSALVYDETNGVLYVYDVAGAAWKGVNVT